MKIHIPAFENGAPIPAPYAFAVPADEGHVQLSDNRNPEVRWEELPEGTRSLVLLCFDPDVPSRPDDVNQEDREVPADLPRIDFFHWVLTDIPADRKGIDEGADSSGVTPRGKDLGKTENGVRGLNDYTNWFKGDDDMEGLYAGYDGPCPPWNDSIVHHYHFCLYALDVESLGLAGEFTGPDVREAMEGHLLAEAKWTGTYTLNPRLRD